MRKYATTGDHIAGCVQLEQEQLAWTQRTEHPIAAWLPEIDLIRRRG
ncbi:hypothetical protein [Methylobacterium sp. ap11]|nr:hypothetical protein [Methylobacterium sp. ap11]